MAHRVDKIADAPVGGEHMVPVRDVGERMVPIQGVGEHVVPIHGRW